jgi:ABC-type uncharacterized transport system substrate-binding protein
LTSVSRVDYWRKRPLLVAGTVSVAPAATAAIGPASFAVGAQAGSTVTPHSGRSGNLR